MTLITYVHFLEVATFTTNTKRMWFFLDKKTMVDDTHVWGKQCDFIHYNVQYVMVIVAYVALKW
jgi:hypothetical protein